MSKSVAVAALVLLAACSQGHVQRDAADLLDDSRTGQSLERFAYTGTWDHTSGRRDGRYDGTSSRSRHVGDGVVFPFDGSVVRVYGIRGPNGGGAAIGIDGKYYGLATFYAPQKQVHALVFQSPPLPESTHTLGIIVQPDPRNAHRAYVNIDAVQVLHSP